MKILHTKTKQTMNFLQPIKRFGQYLKYIDYNAVIYFICEIIDALQPIFIIQITSWIIKAIEDSDTGQLYFLIKIFIWLIVLQYITNRLWEIMHDRAFEKIECKLTQNYMSKYISMDQTTTEKYGTGKLNNVFANWTNSICGILLELGLAVVVEIVGLIYAIYLLATKSPTIYHFVALVGIMILGIFFLAKWLSKIQYARKMNKEISMEIDRLRAKIIMSKNEILQNNKINEENSKFYNFYKKSADLRTRANTQKHAWQVRTNILFDGARVFIYLSMWLAVISWNYQIAYMLLLLELLRLSDGYIWNIRKYFRDIYKESVNIAKLREIVDNTPSIDYKKWSDFIYHNGDIKIENLSFSYGDTVGSDFWSDRDFWSDNYKNGNAKNGNAKSISLQDNKNYIFQNFNLQIQGWTKTAFVGESWWGKTTLIKLLAWYIRPDSGSVEIDGQVLFDGVGSDFWSDRENNGNIKKGNAKSISLQSYYKHIGYLTQEPSVFDGTIWENLVYGLPDDVGTKYFSSENKQNDNFVVGSDFWSDRENNKNIKNGNAVGTKYFSSENKQNDNFALQDRINEIIKLSKCEFIYDFENKLQTEIWERWVRLSGWQKQRLAIAKIMLKNPDIIFLDEPTSALDSFNEELVSEALNNLFKGKTVIVVAHRLQTVKSADKICYIARGNNPLSGLESAKILEEWTHDELVTLNGKYKKMLDLQSGF